MSAALDLKFTDENAFPPLPPIHDDDIRVKIFTHRSFYARPNHVFEDQPDDPSPDNEKFEHLGDTVLGLCVTGLLHHTYPNLRVGPCTKIRSLIVGNATLASISRRYKLPARLRLHPAQAITLKASSKIQANIFESYVGGLYLDQGLPAVERWLNVLLKPYATEAYTRVRTQHGLPPSPPPVPSPLVPRTTTSSDPSGSTSTSKSTSRTPPSEGSEKSTQGQRVPLRYPHASGTPTTTGHLALFNQHVNRDKLEIEWVYDGSVSEKTATTPIWVAHIKVDGDILGWGKGTTKKEARNEAAKVALVQMGTVV